MKLLICVPTSEVARRADFYDYFNMLEKPVGTIITMVHGQSPARNRNLAIEQAIVNDCTHILFIDDDVMVAPDTFNKLVMHDKDIVTGLYPMRSYPHQPILFDISYEDGRCSHFFPKDDETGLVEIVNCGLGCCLIKTDVFKQMEKPWIRLGECEIDHWCDDVGFFNRARAAGFKLYCDLSVTAGHVTSAIVKQQHAGGKWITTYETNGTGIVAFPMLRPNDNRAEK